MESTNQAPLFGREQELASLKAALDRGERVITIVGPGGVGKTRLARELGAQIESCFCDLGSVVATDGLLFALAQAAQCSVAGMERKAAMGPLAEAVSTTRLLVLDNCEHLIDDVSQLISALHDAGLTSTIVATSRERLRQRDELVVDLAPLIAPPADEADNSTIMANPAVALFVERAKRIDSGFQAHADDWATIARIARRLDGLPLALELAASRVSIMGVADLERRLEQSLTMLDHGPRNVAARQRTLQATVEWSWNLLSEDERLALAELSLFGGDFTISDAEALLSANAVSLTQALRDKSLLASNGVYLRMPILIRAFAQGRLAELDPKAQATSRLVSHYGRLGKELGERLEHDGSEHLDAAVRLREHFESAFDWAEQGHGDFMLATYALFAVAGVYLTRGPLDGYANRLARARERLSELSADDELLTLGAFTFGRILSARGDLDGSQAAFKEALARPTGAKRRAFLHLSLGHVATARDDYETAVSHYQDGLKLARAAGEELLAGRILSNLGVVEVERGNLDGARTYYGEALVVYRRLGDSVREGTVLGNIGNIFREEGDLDSAASHYSRAVEHALDGGDLVTASIFEGMLAAVHQARNELDKARPLYQRACERLEAAGHLAAPVLFGMWSSALADADEIVLAEATLGKARALSKTDAPCTSLDVHEGNLQLALARRAASHGQTKQAAQHREQALAATIAGGIANERVRTALDLLQAALDREEQTAATKALLVARDGSSVELPNGARIDLCSRPTLRRVMVALATARDAQPGHGLSPYDVFDAGWPGEQIMPDAAMNRVRVAISTLRRLGLRDMLVTDDGYRLDSSIRLMWSSKP